MSNISKFGICIFFVLGVIFRKSTSFIRVEYSFANYSNSNYQTEILSTNFRKVSPYKYHTNKANYG